MGANARRWVVLLGATLGCATGVGPMVYGVLGVFLKPMTEQFGWSRAEFALSFSLASIFPVVVLPVAGYLIDRFGPRRVAAFGIVGFSLVYACFGLVTSYAMFLVVASLAGSVGVISGVPTFVAFLPRWFDKRRGIAMGIASSGIAIGIALLPLLVAYTIARSSWQAGFLVLAGLSLVAGLVSVVFLLKENTGALPSQERRSPGAGQEAGIPFASAVRMPDFWRLSISFALVVMINFGVSFHIAALMADRGYTPAQAGGFLALIGTSTLAMRYVAGFALDYVSARLIGFVTFLAQALAVIVLILGSGQAAPVAAAILLGVAYGAEGDLLPFTLSRRFGTRAYGRLYTLAYSVISLAQVITPPLLGWSFDRLGSYTAVLWAFPVISLGAAVLIAVSDVGDGRRFAALNTELGGQPT